MKRRDALRFAAATIAAAVPAVRAESRPIVLGQSAALSGPASALGDEFRRGALLYFEHLNVRGGIDGRAVLLRTLDDGYEPSRCAENTRELIASGVSALFGYIGTPTSQVALPMATAARVPFVAPYSGAEALRSPFNRYAIHVRASYLDETAEIVKQASLVGLERFGVFYQDDGYGKAGLDGVMHALNLQHLAPPVGLGTVERNTVEVDQAVKAILAGRPDAIVLVSAYKSCAAFIRRARGAGFSGMFYSLSFVGTQALAAELGREAKGVAISQVMPYPFSAAIALTREYLAAGNAPPGAVFEPSYGSMEGYVAAKAMAEALRRASPSASGEGLVAGFESMRDFDLGGFFVDFSARKHTGSKFVDLTILSDDGKVYR